MKFSESGISVKSPITISEQLRKLKARGLVIDDEVKAYRSLETINYFRLVHYFAVFLEENGVSYKSGTRFEDGLRLYRFDRKLRTEILVALEEIEIAVRAAVSNYHSVKYGAIGYLNPDSFDRHHNHRVFAHKVERMIEKNADLNFVRHHNKKYGGKLPLWVMMEMFSFGMLVFFFQDLNLHDKKDIAKYYFNLDHRHIENWLEKLADLRNHCAHYNRVYGNPIPTGLKPAEIEKFPDYEMNSSLFDYLLVIRMLHKSGDEWSKYFTAELEALFEHYSDIVDPRVLGFPENWKEFLL